MRSASIASYCCATSLSSTKSSSPKGRSNDWLLRDIEQNTPSAPAAFFANAARDREFRTSTGKARFTVHPLPRTTLADDEYLMMTIRSHDQYNTTIYGLDDRYRGISHGRRVVLMNAADIASAGLTAGDWVDLFCGHSDRRRTAHRFAVVPYDIPKRCVATYFPEANVLVPIDSVADISNTPASKSVVITMHRHAELPTASHGNSVTLPNPNGFLPG